MATVLVFKALSITAPALLALLLTAPVFAATPEKQINEEQANAELARQFYQQVWFSDHPDVVDQLFATEYVLHDDGNGDGFLEPAEAQKAVAGFLWENGGMGGSIDYQIA